MNKMDVDTEWLSKKGQFCSFKCVIGVIDVGRATVQTDTLRIHNNHLNNLPCRASHRLCLLRQLVQELHIPFSLFLKLNST